MLDSNIDDFVTSLVLERGLSEKTCIAYGGDLRFFAAYLKRRKIENAADVTRDDIVDFLANEREQGMKGSTRARRTAAIRMFFRYLKERRLIPTNPSDLMDAPKKALALPRVLSEAEVFAMLDEVKGDGPVPLRDRAMLEVMYGCGLRVSELCASSERARRSGSFRSAARRDGRLPPTSGAPASPSQKGISPRPMSS